MDKREKIIFIGCFLAFLFICLAQTNLSFSKPIFSEKIYADKVSASAQGAFKYLQYSDKPLSGEDFTFETVEGEKHNLKSLKGKTLMVVLWASWCGPCLKELPDLDHLQKILKGDKFEIITINTKILSPSANKVFNKLNIQNLTNYIDKDDYLFSNLSKQGFVFGFPAVFLFDKNLDLITFYNGLLPWGSREGQSFLQSIIKAQE